MFTKKCIFPCLFLFLLFSNAIAECPKPFLMKWGSYGTGDGQFAGLGGIAIDDSGYVYVQDINNLRIQKFSSRGVFIKDWIYSEFSPYNGSFNIDIDNDEYLYVPAAWESYIIKYTLSGMAVDTIGEHGEGDGQLKFTCGVATDNAGYIYVRDAVSLSRVQKFTNTGTFVLSWGSYGTGDGQFRGGSGITVDDSGFVYVADGGNYRIQKFTSNGTFVLKWGSRGTGYGEFEGTAGITVDDSGFVYVTDAGNDRIQKFTSSGDFVIKWGNCDYGNNGCVIAPQGICINDSGFVYVSDPGTPGVQVFSDIDRDGDGLLDAWEINGINADCDSIGRIDYILTDADPDHKDLYVEVDAMQGLAPAQSTLDSVIAAFARAPNYLLVPPNPDSLDGINLHIDLDETNLNNMPWGPSGWNGGPWPDFESAKANHFGKPAEQGDPLKLAAKKLAYRYCIFINTFDGATSGIAEDYGCNDFVVALGHPSWQPVTPEDQAGTFMHELGHALGLRHGGGDDILYKPNYPSVMNWLWQVPNRDNLSGADSIALDLFRKSWRLEYSESRMIPLNENSLDENTPLGGDCVRFVPVGPKCGTANPTVMIVSMGMAVDWDRDQNVDTSPVCADANYIPPLPYSGSFPGENLSDYSDWSNIQYLPSGTQAWSDAPRPYFPSTPMQELTFEIVDSLSSLTFDCNGNGIPDGIEIDSGALEDTNGNGIPDICEGITTGIKDDNPTPELALSIRSYPNPFNPQTAIVYIISETSYVSLCVYDVQGRLIATLISESKIAGEYEVMWDGRNSSGTAVASGIYFIHLSAGEHVQTLKIVLIK